MNIPEMSLSTPSQPAQRLSPVAEHLIGGIVTLFVGLAMLWVARGFTVLALPGAICVAVGAGLLVVGTLVLPFVKRPGRTA